MVDLLVWYSVDEVASRCCGVATLETRRVGNFDPFEMVRGACGFLIREGPISARPMGGSQGYSPSTLRSTSQSRMRSGVLRRSRRRCHGRIRSRFADFLESHIERWDRYNGRNVLPGITRHYVRVNPCGAVTVRDEDPNHDAGTRNQPPVRALSFPRKKLSMLVSRLVRYGIRGAQDPIIQESLRVVDACV